MGPTRPRWVEARRIDFWKFEVEHHDQSFPYLLSGLLQAKRKAGQSYQRSWITTPHHKRIRWFFSACESFQLLGSRFKPRQFAKDSIRPQLTAFPVIEKMGRPVRSISAALIVSNPGAENSSCNAATVMLIAYRTSGFGWHARFCVCFQYTRDIE